MATENAPLPQTLSPHEAANLLSNTESLLGEPDPQEVVEEETEQEEVSPHESEIVRS